VIGASWRSAGTNGPSNKHIATSIIDFLYASSCSR
jgi:hypothetical protein